MTKTTDLIYDELYDVLKDAFELNLERMHDEEEDEAVEAVKLKDLICEITEKYLKNCSSLDELQDIRNSTMRNTRKTKKRWLANVKLEIEDPPKAKDSTISRELKVFKHMNINEFRDAFRVESISELIQQRIEDAERWANDKNSRLCDFRYFSYKKYFQKVSAITNDILKEILNHVENHYGGTLSGYVRRRPVELIENPIFSLNKILTKLDEKIDKQSPNAVLHNDYYVSEDYIIRTLIQNQDAVKLTRTYTLDTTDSDILDVAFSKIKPHIYHDRTIQVDVRELADEVFGYVSSDSYKNIEERIMKLSRFNVQGLVIEEGNIKDTTFALNFFDRAYVGIDKETGKLVATIGLGAFLFERYVHGMTVGISSYQANQLDLPVSKMLLYALQKERLSVSSKENLSNYGGEYHYEYFKKRIQFKSKNKRENMSIIESGMREMMEKRIAIKNAITEGDAIKVEFIALTPDEIEAFGMKVKELE